MLGTHQAMKLTPKAFASGLAGSLAINFRDG
jgi:hypothetical protein